MKILDKIPSALEGRAAGPMAAISCDCGVPFLWDRRRGNKVRCPSCKAEADLNIGASNAPVQSTDQGHQP